ncbi:MAG: hypothetical protein Kow0076_8580 [Francisella sp.]
MHSDNKIVGQGLSEFTPADYALAAELVRGLRVIKVEAGSHNFLQSVKLW